MNTVTLVAIRIRLIVIYTFVSCLALSCKSNLSKEDAQKQLAAYFNASPPTFILYSPSIVNPDVPETNEYVNKVGNAKEAGYLSYTYYPVQEYLHSPELQAIGIELNDEYKSMLVERKEHRKFYNGLQQYELSIKSGTYNVDIVSMNEPAADASGNIVCNVMFNYYVERNKLVQIFYPKAVRKDNCPAKFIKTQDGWELWHRDGVDRIPPPKW